MASALLLPPSFVLISDGNRKFKARVGELKCNNMAIAGARRGVGDFVACELVSGSVVVDLSLLQKGSVCAYYDSITDLA